MKSSKVLLLAFATLTAIFAFQVIVSVADKGTPQAKDNNAISFMPSVQLLLLGDKSPLPKSTSILIDVLLGGSISIQNSRGDVVTLEVPANALRNTTNITLTSLDAPPINPIGSNIFPGVILEPDGLVLIKPATLRITLANPLAEPALSRIFLLANQGLAVPISRQAETELTIEGEIFHFSPYLGGVPTMKEINSLIIEILVRRGSMVTLELLYIVDDVFSFLELAKMQEALGRTDLADATRNSALGMLEERTLKSLDQPIPSNPCQDYRVALYHLVEVVREFLNDDTIIQLLRDKIEAVETDHQCVEVMTGVWRLTPVSQNERCRYTGQDWWEEDPFSSFDVKISHQGGLDSSFIEASYVPDTGSILTGTWNAKSGSFNLSIDTANVGECGYLFYNSDICGDAIECTLVSCHITTDISGSTSPSGTTLDAESTWSYSVTFSYGPGSPPGLNTWECEGSATLHGLRQ